MPGLRRQPGASSYTSSMYADVHSVPTLVPQQQRYSWDRESSVVSRKPMATSRVQARAPKWLQHQTGRDYLGTKGVCTAPAVSVCYGSNESDDLQAMVHDFIENDPLEFMDGGDSDRASPGKKRFESLQMCISSLSSLERQLLAEVKTRLLSIKDDTDLVCFPVGSDCKGACVKRFVVKHLKVAGFDAALCTSKWLSSGRVPGGEYEYIAVDATDSQMSDSVIVDVDFQAQFEIARPTAQYESALRVLPAVFVGSAPKLRKVLEFMSDAAKVSLKQNHMHLPPWRTLSYMSSKWLSPRDRTMAAPDLIAGGRWSAVAKQCSEQLRHTKLALVAEMKASSGHATSHNLTRSNKACATNPFLT